MSREDDATGGHAPRLAPPGAGVPWLQRAAGRWLLLPRWCRRVGWDGAAPMLARQGQRLLALGDRLDRTSRARRVLVPPQVGLEDSSRFYSWAMVLEHLARIHDGTAEIVVELSHGRRPALVVDTAALKPTGTMPPAEAVETYRAGLERFARRTAEEVGDPDSRVRHRHPWFGGLTARQWIVFAPFHQAIHLRQAERIVEALLSSEPGSPARGPGG